MGKFQYSDWKVLRDIRRKRETVERKHGVELAQLLLMGDVFVPKGPQGTGFMPELWGRVYQVEQIAWPKVAAQYLGEHRMYAIKKFPIPRRVRVTDNRKTSATI